jgi:GAF domain-containing protein
MSLERSDRISAVLARIADLRKRAHAATDPVSKAELRGLESNWQDVLDSYMLVQDGKRFLNGVRGRRSAAAMKLIQSEPVISQVEGPAAAKRASLAELLKVLVCVATEHADRKARAAFYLSDASEQRLHHVIGMPDEYAQCVDGFAIGRQLLACGLAVATRQAIITPDVSEEPRWKEWIWLANQFDYRACWSFPVATSSGRVLGSFAMYYPEPHEATPGDVRVAEAVTRAAATIITETLPPA